MFLFNWVRLSVIPLILFSSIVFSQNIITIESRVTGSKEQPKVITIVPWREAGEPDYYGEDVSADLDEAELLFKPMNRASFIQEVQYIRAIHKK